MQLLSVETLIALQPVAHVLFLIGAFVFGHGLGQLLRVWTSRRASESRPEEDVWTS